MNHATTMISKINFLAVMILVTNLLAQTQIQLPAHLTLKDALQTALTYHPSLRSAEAGVRVSKALLIQAKSNFLPEISFSAGGSHIDGYFVFNPSFPPRKQTYDSYNASLQAQQIIFDFSKTFTSVSVGKYNLESSQEDYQSAREAVALNLQLAYFQMIEAEHIVTVNEQTVKQAESHLQRARGFHLVGKSPQFDVTRAEVDLANANVALIGARNRQAVARVQLLNAMGISLDHEFSVVDSFKVEPFPMPLDSVVQIAMQRRPELRSAMARIESNRALVRVACSQHLPTLLASGSYSWNGFNFPLQSRWNAGLTLSFPIFQGFNVWAKVQQAQANENAAQAAFDALSQQVMLEVQQNYLNLKEAGERILASQKLLEQAEENLQLAEARYNSGIGSAIEITDARTVLCNSSITNIQALFDYNSSLVLLQWSMGTLPVD
jgi:outer membrane protein